MSLYIDLSIGPRRVESVRVSRVTNVDTAVLDPDAVSTYEVAVPVARDRAGERIYSVSSTVQHRYGDGATELARKALNALAEQPDCTWVDTTTYAGEVTVQTCTLHGDTRTYPRTETTP